MTRYLLCFILLSAFTATAQNPIPRVGDKCPTGTYRSGDYCKPFKSSKDTVIIEKNGSKCPTGFYTSGSYCKRISSSDREALPRPCWYNRGMLYPLSTQHRVSEDYWVSGGAFCGGVADEFTAFRVQSGFLVLRFIDI